MIHSHNMASANLKTGHPDNTTAALMSLAKPTDGLYNPHSLKKAAAATPAVQFNIVLSIIH